MTEASEGAFRTALVSSFDHSSSDIDSSFEFRHSSFPPMSAPDDPLDIENPSSFLAYLRESGRIRPDESPPSRTLAGGVSNKTVLVERPSGESWVIKQALPKLRVAVDWFSDPRRIERE